MVSKSTNVYGLRALLLVLVLIMFRTITHLSFIIVDSGMYCAKDNIGCIIIIGVPSISDPVTSPFHLVFSSELFTPTSDDYSVLGHTFHRSVPETE